MNEKTSLRFVGDRILVSSGTLARLEWAEANREKGKKERQTKEANEQKRQQEKRELHRKVGLARSASYGRVAASRENLHARNAAHRRVEAAREQFALEEKERRLQVAKDDRAALHAAKFRPITPDRARSLASFDSRSSLSTIATPQHRAAPQQHQHQQHRAAPHRPPSWVGNPGDSDKLRHKKYLSYVKMEVPDGCHLLHTIPVAQATHARWAWSETNRERGNVERRVKEENEERRAAEQREICERVALVRSASAGKVAASRETLLAAKREQRRAEIANQLNAKAEKERRQQAARDDYAKVVAAKFKPITHSQFLERMKRFG